MRCPFMDCLKNGKIFEYNVQKRVKFASKSISQGWRVDGAANCEKFGLGVISYSEHIFVIQNLRAGFKS